MEGPTLVWLDRRKLTGHLCHRLHSYTRSTYQSRNRQTLNSNVGHRCPAVEMSANGTVAALSKNKRRQSTDAVCVVGASSRAPIRAHQLATRRRHNGMITEIFSRSQGIPDRYCELICSVHPNNGSVAQRDEPTVEFD